MVTISLCHEYLGTMFMGCTQTYSEFSRDNTCQMIWWKEVDVLNDHAIQLTQLVNMQQDWGG